MKPANLSWSALLLVAGAAGACGPAAGPPTMMITTPLEAEPPRPPGRVVAAGSTSPALESVRDERFSRRAPRATALLIVEVQGLESLYRATPMASPDRPKLLRRLAENYAELALAAERELAQQALATAARSPSLDRRVTAARAEAIAHYQILDDEYPRWCAVPSAGDPATGTGCADEVLYYLGLTAERAGQLDLARRSYLSVVQDHPQSRFIPAAYLAFGELFRAEADKDRSKLPLARQAYLEVVTYPPPENHVYGYAQYRLAEVHALEGDDPEALSCLVKAVLHARASGDGTGLADAARRELVAVYARAGDPAKARAFFAQVASSAEELEAMEKELSRRRQAP